MRISGLAKSSLIDYPGYPCCVLFAPGCNYDCFYCHNRALIEGKDGPLDPDKVFGFLKKRAGVLEAAVVSGGEPTLQSDLIPFLRSVKELGYRLKLDTNGSDPRTVSELLSLGLCDYFAVDYKAPRARYGEICGAGADARPVSDTVARLLSSGVPFEVRTTVVPQLGADDLISMAGELPKVPRWVLNRYRPPEYFRPADEKRILETPYTPAQLASFAEAMRPAQPGVRI